ncbi:MAG: seryl-tRNA synthetase [Verrucomicrobiales bacterium]|jgi:seryl-tRNA synthetase
MLDIRLLREDPDGVAERVKTRGGDAHTLVADVLACDEERRKAETEKQALQGDRKRISKQIGQLKGKGEDTSKVEAEVREIGDKIKTLSEGATAAEDRQRDLLLQIPNLPHADCPVGQDETANPEVRIWGEKPEFDFEPKDHLTLCTEGGLLDFETAAKISTGGFALFKGQGARLERALIQFLLDLHTAEHGYTEYSPPFIINRDCMTGTGQLPKFEDDMYGIEDGKFFLAPTAEVPVTNMWRDMIVKADELPIKATAYTPCFRKEAGASGRENRGLIRMHQFDKVELVQIVHPDDSFKTLETLTSEAEKVLQLLGLHYRTIELCTGDISDSSTKTYDIEVWAPGQGSYLEVSSCSNFVDYQARRMNLRFKDEDGKNKVCHTLNGSGTALPRLFVALVETYQQADGSILIPEALQRHFGSEKIG